jgi:hypothetical protein
MKAPGFRARRYQDCGLQIVMDVMFALATLAMATLHQARPDLSIAWLSLDETDSDPARILTLLLAALQHHFLEFGLMPVVYKISN